MDADHYTDRDAKRDTYAHAECYADIVTNEYSDADANCNADYHGNFYAD
jgi:hypothetical protein